MLTTRYLNGSKLISFVDQEGCLKKVRFHNKIDGPVRHGFVANGVFVSYVINDKKITEVKGVVDGDTAQDVHRRATIYEDGRWYTLHHRTSWDNKLGVTVVGWRRDENTFVVDSMSCTMIDKSYDYIYYGGRVHTITHSDVMLGDIPASMILPATICYGNYWCPLKVRPFNGKIHLIAIITDNDANATMIGEWCMRTESITWIHKHIGARDYDLFEITYVADNVVQYMMRDGERKNTWHYYNITDDTQYDVS